MAIGFERLTSRQEARILAVQQERVELIERRKRRRAARKTKNGGPRRPHRQWHVRYAGFVGSDAPRDVFPLVDDWPLMLGIMAGMDQKDSVIVIIVAVAYAWLVLLVFAPRTVFSFHIVMPKMPEHLGLYGSEGQLRGTSLL